MLDKQGVRSVQIELKVGEYTNFIIIIARDGAIQRYGPVEPGATGDLKMAMLQEPIIDTLVASVPEYVFDYLDRRFACSDDIAGKPCSLTLTFEDAQGELSGIRFDYGSDSKGPPADVMALVEGLREKTDSWYYTT